MVFGAANRDERIFAHPDRFDLWRPNADQHLAFGHGIHHCLGAPFVRMEARIALEVLVQRLPDVHLVPAQTITYLPSLLNRALQHRQVRWGTSLPAPVGELEDDQHRGCARPYRVLAEKY